MACLNMLALALPRAGLTDDDIGRLIDLWFNLMSKAGLTGKMMMEASEKIVMAPTKGKPKFFPDPGSLAELCADDAHQRKMALAALARALAIIDGKAVEHKPAPIAPRPTAEELARRLQFLNARLPPKPAPARFADDAAPERRTSAAASNTALLKASLANRTGKTIEQIEAELIERGLAQQRT